MATGKTLEEARENERFQTFLRWIEDDAPIGAQRALLRGARRRLPQIQEYLDDHPEQSAPRLQEVLEQVVARLGSEADEHRMGL